MAENVAEEDGVFWLPSEFLSDDENQNDVNKKNDDVSRRMFSYLSSPLESSETESSDEEDQYLAELTRRVANTSLELDLHRNSFLSPKSKGVVVNGSPESTMCGCCGKISSSSSQGSPNSVCHVTSQRATWDLLREAAGEVERMRVSDEERRRFFINHHHQNPRLVVPNRNNYNGIVGFNHNQHSLTHQQLQIAQFEMMRQQQIAKQRHQLLQKQQEYVPVSLGAQNREKYGEIGAVVVGGGNGGRSLNGGLCATAWPPLQRNVKQHRHLQQRNGVSGMTAVFPVNPSGKRESTGTGVFLPRRIDAPPETKKKSACSTVLVPARVVQALNLKLEDMVPQNNHNQPHFNVTPSMENVHAGGASAIQRTRCNYGFPQQRRNNQRPKPQVNREVRLPQDWTY